MLMETLEVGETAAAAIVARRLWYFSDEVVVVVSKNFSSVVVRAPALVGTKPELSERWPNERVTTVVAVAIRKFHSM